MVDLYFELLLLLLLLFLLVSPVNYHCVQYIEYVQKLILNVVLLNGVVFGVKIDTGNINFKKLL